MWTLLRDNPRFRRLFVAEAVMNFGETAVYLSLAIWIKDLTGSNTKTGLVFLAITAPGLAAPLLGHLVDRVHRKRLMMRMYGAMSLLFLTLLAVRGVGQVWLIYVVTVAYGVLSATPARPALLKDFLPSKDAATARSLLLAASQGVRIVSPAVGAAVYVGFGGHALAIAGAVTFLAAVLLLASIQIAESAPEPSAEPFRRSVVVGFHFIPKVSLLFRLTLTAFAFMAVIGLLETAVFAATDQGLHQKPAFFGVITSFQGGGSVVGGLVAGWAVKKWRESGAAGIGYALMGIGLLLCLLANVPLFLVGVVIFGFGMPFVLLALGTAFHLYTPSRMQGRANAALSMITGGAQTASVAAGAALIGVLGYRVMYLLMACTAVVCALWIGLSRIVQPEIAKSVADDDEDEPAGTQAAPANAVPATAVVLEPETR